MDLVALRIIPFLHRNGLACTDSVLAYGHRGAEVGTGQSSGPRVGRPDACYMLRIACGIAIQTSDCRGKLLRLSNKLSKLTPFRYPSPNANPHRITVPSPQRQERR